MKKYFLLLLSVFFLSPTFALCNFGTMQPALVYSAVPGATLEAKVYIYNLYGDRITHVKVSSVSVPEGWTYSFEPEASYVTYSISGQETQIYENLAVEPMGQTNDTSKYEGVEYLQSPSVMGMYIPAKVIKMKLDVPSNVPLWKTYDFSFTLDGWCLADQPGSVSTLQQRTFDFRVKTVALEFYEQRVSSPWEIIGQYAVYIAIVGAVLITIVVLVILRKMGKLIIKVEIK